MATYSSIKYNFTPPDATTSAQVGAGAMKLIKELTASSSATLSFVDGTSDVVLDNTYKTYIFKFFNMHPATSGVFWLFQGNVAGGSGYDETIQSNTFRAVATESDGSTAIVTYIPSIDQANGTAFQNICSDGDIKTDNDSCISGELWLFNPSNTTFVTHFLATTNHMVNNSQSSTNYIGGYFNTTAAIDEIQFKFNSGNIDSGTVKLYGIA